MLDKCRFKNSTPASAHECSTLKICVLGIDPDLHTLKSIIA